MARFRMTERMKQSKVFSAVMFPVTAYYILGDNLPVSTIFSRLAGKGYVTYDTREQRISTMLSDKSGKGLSADYYNLEIDYDKAFVVVTTEVIQ